MAPGLRNSNLGIFVVFEFSQPTGNRERWGEGCRGVHTQPKSGTSVFPLPGRSPLPDFPGQCLLALEALPLALLLSLGAGRRSPISPWCQLFQLQPQEIARGHLLAGRASTSREGLQSHSRDCLTLLPSVPSGPDRLSSHWLVWLSTHGHWPSAFLRRTQGWELEPLVTYPDSTSS